MVSTVTLTLNDGIRIVVPDSLDAITTYVLREQGDWFEPEIKFVRQLLQPADKVIDVGANYGVYTLSMARCVGPTGQVWAFEPASTTAGLLARSISANKFAQVLLKQCALSSSKGDAQLYLSEHSEINTLSRERAYGGRTESVTLLTLDECFKTNNWSDIAYVKIDAEDEEENILRGGVQFFSAESPLVQYEVRSAALNLDLVRIFANLGYQSYRLVPGLNLLVPFDEDEDIDIYLLNLFACKPDRAARLAERGLLVDEKTVRENRESQLDNMFRYLTESQSGAWLDVLTKYPYGQMCTEHWRKTVAAGMNYEVRDALILYDLSRRQSLGSAEQFAALERGYINLRRICENEPKFLRLSSLARFARDYGSQSSAVDALARLANTIFQQRQVDVSEPFLAPGKRFDSIAPREPIMYWVLASVLEELERAEHVSSYYMGGSNLRRLEIIRDLGYGGDEMNMRLKLAQQRLKETKPS